MDNFLYTVVFMGCSWIRVVFGQRVASAYMPSNSWPTRVFLPTRVI